MNNPLHYPDLERCKKLKEIWYPLREAESPFANWERPSVMEMLDVIPEEINEYSLWIRKQYNWDYDVCFSDPMGDEMYDWFWTLPNALADLILWLVENGYLTFDLWKK